MNRPSTAFRRAATLAVGGLVVLTTGCAGTLTGSGSTVSPAATPTANAPITPGASTPAATTAASTPTATTASAACTTATPNWQQIADKASASVASVTVVRGGQAVSQGSAVVIDGLHLVTNAHVVAGRPGDTYQLTMPDNSVLNGRLVGADVATDLAVLAVQGPGLTPIALGSSSDLAVGQPVMAIGNPLGLSGTVTTGVVSALNRPVIANSSGSGSSSGEPVVTNAIQTSAAINPGNSGGALVDGCGNLIGINSSIATLGEGSGNIGIGFAIPVSDMQLITGQLIESGRAQHAQLGVNVGDMIASVDGRSVRAASITGVATGGPAAAAGLRTGDAVVSLDGAPVDSSRSLIAHIRSKAVGSKVSLGIVRDGQSSTVDVTLAAAAR